jgi:hypothetical protein
MRYYHKLLQNDNCLSLPIASRQHSIKFFQELITELEKIIGRQVAFIVFRHTLYGTAYNSRFATMLARRKNNGHFGTINYYPAEGILLSICCYLQQKEF